RPARRNRKSVRYGPAEKLSRRGTVNVAVNHPDAGTAMRQRMRDGFGHHDRTVAPAGTAESDGEIAFPFPDIVRQKEAQQFGDAREEPPRLWKRPNVTRHTRVPAGERPELRKEVGIRQEAHVKH